MAVQFACPECRAQLSVGEAAPRCEACGTQFGGLEGLPILVAGTTASDVDQRAAGEKLPGHDCRALGIAEVDAAFEATSALGTVGLSTGMTGELRPLAKSIVIILMLVGRLGPITVFVALSQAERKKSVDYPNEEPMIG